MHHFRLLFLSCITFLISLFTHAQPVQYRFEHFTSEHGLPQNTVYDACQDKYGFMWFSTKNGVCRYDGYHTTVFRPSNFTNEEVADLSQCIEPDSDGDILFGTSLGFYYINIETDSISSRIVYENGDTADSYKMNVYSLCTEGTVAWAGTGNGLIRYDKRTRSLRYFSGKELYPDLKASRLWIKNIALDKKGFLWLATPEGLFRMDTRTYKTEVFSSRATGNHFVSNNYFSSVAFDNKGRLWAGTLRKGVYRFDLDNGTVDSLNYTGLSDSSEAFNETKRLLCDSKGYIWAATQYTGVVRIHPNTFSYQRIRQNPMSVQSISSDFISALFEDKSGILWVGTYNSGADRTNVGGSRFINIPSSSTDSSCFPIKAVECFTEQGDSMLWVGTMKGLFRFDKRLHTCESFENITGGKINLPHQSIAGLEIDNQNRLWIGTRSDVLVRVNLDNFSYKQFRPDTTQPLVHGSLDFKTMIKGPDGTFYFSFDTRLFRLKSNSDSLELIMDRDSVILNLKRNHRIFIEGRYLFIASEFAGLHKLDLKTNKIERIQSPDMERDLISQNVQVARFPDGKYLISDYKGFYILDSSLHFTGYFNDKNGLSDNKVCGVHIDGGGKVWLATFNGLASFQPATGRFLNYFTQDGLAENEFREGKTMKGFDGTMYLPTNKGFTFFHPDRIYTSLRDISIFFTEFRIFGKPTKFANNINSLKQIYVPSGNNFFSISFSSTSYNTLQPARFAYKLEGVDPNWVVAEGINTANYTNIDGGEYTFRVRLHPNASAERVLKIKVGTIFYKTFGFRLFIFFLLVFTVYYFNRFREKQMIRKESDQTIDYFANSFYGRNSVEEILWDVCRNCISRLGFEDAVVYLVDKKRKVLVQKAAYGPKNPKDFEIVHPLEIPLGQGIVGSVAISGKAEIITDTQRDPRYIADDDTRQSEIAVPIIYQNEVIGVIDSENSRKGFFKKEHLRILSTIASICSTKLAKAQSDLAAAEHERLLLEIGKKVAETRLMALRAQMNPHFIFNSLNSIQECIVKEKVEEAHTYLSRFSRLLRMVIDYSEKSLISLDQEIQFLNLYLGLESLRFGQSFTYSIQVDPSLDGEETLVPSLLIQPFVENAIWHGLLHKNGDRKLYVSFIQRDQLHLVCVVEDNGIGRIRAAEIKAGKFDSAQHESKGMRISQERIDLVRLQTALNPEIDIEDLFDESGKPTGTRVSVILPLELNENELNA